MRAWSRFVAGSAVALAAAGAAAQAAPGAAPPHIRRAAVLIDDLVPLSDDIEAARRRLDERGFFCAWGGAPLLENVGARFLVCSESCAVSRDDGWWVYLTEVVGRGVRFIAPGHAGSSLIKPHLPDGCPPAGAPR
ncbi:MAG: hypothetical protein JNM90_06480 [Burkholderiales bacterium]|nr:hypothetical protein [Burkholderiales bacterium]